MLSLNEAQAHPHGVVVMEADCGGQILLTCPARLVTCGPEALELLLSDLEGITWGRGFDPTTPPQVDCAQIYYEATQPGSGVPGGCGGGVVTEDLWVHPELGIELRLTDQIKRVLTGHQTRLLLAPGFPNTPLDSLLDARAFPHASVQLWSGRKGWRLVCCPAAAVQITHDELLVLIRELDDWFDQRRHTKIEGPPPPGSITYSIRPPHDIGTRSGGTCLYPAALEELRPTIERILAGNRPLLPGL